MIFQVEEDCNYKPGARILSYDKYSELAIMREFNWKKVATINQGLEFFSMVGTVS